MSALKANTKSLEEVYFRDPVNMRGQILPMLARKHVTGLKALEVNFDLRTVKVKHQLWGTVHIPLENIKSFKLAPDGAKFE